MKDLNEFKKFLIGIADDSRQLKCNINSLLNLAHAINKGLDKPFSVKEVESVCTDIVNAATPPYTDKKGNVITYLLAEFMVKRNPMFANGYNIYVYNGGVYEPMDERILHKAIFSYMVLDTNKTTAKAKEVLESIRTISYVVDMNKDVKKYINTKNGIIDIESRKLLRHSPKYKTTLQFQGNLIPDEQFDIIFENSDFKKFLDTTLSDRSVVTLQEMFGLILSPHAREVQKAFFLLGDGSNGKSTVADIITALVGGHQFIAGLGLSHFENRFDLGALEGKHINLNVDDESSMLEKTGRFKSIIAGDPIDIEKKGKDKVSYLPNITSIIGLNRMPSTGDKSHGFYRRQCIIPFNVKFGTQDEVNKGLATLVKNPVLTKNIIENEMDVVFTWALQGLYNVIDNNFVLSDNDEVAAELEEYRVETDSAYAFYKYRIELSPFENDKVKASEVYNEYKKYCMELGVTPLNGTNFGRGLKGLGLSTKRCNDGNYYTGIFGFKTNNQFK